jgi:hypothetical protein
VASFQWLCQTDRRSPHLAHISDLLRHPTRLTKSQSISRRSFWEGSDSASYLDQRSWKMDIVTVMLPHGPTVMTHKGWQPRKPLHLEPPTQSNSRIHILSPHCSRTLVQEDPSNLISPPQKRSQRIYQFINSEKPATKSEPEVLKVIRRHVRKEFIRHSRQMTASTKEDLKVQGPNCNFQNTATFDTYLLAPSTSFSEYPIEMPPSTHALLNNYLTYANSRMFPIGSSFRTSPLKSPEWFHFAITDPAMFHAMLYAAATYLALLEGKSESRDTIYHQNQTILILQNRLNISKQQFDDSTLGAISCLAIGGVCLFANQALITNLSRPYQVT